MTEPKSLKDKVFEACDYLENANQKVTREKVQEQTGGNSRDVSKYINEWKASKETAITVAQTSELAQSEQELTAISDESESNSVPIQSVTLNADIEQIKLNAAERVKAMKIAELHVTRAMLENPDLIPEDIRQEIEAAEMATISTPPFHQGYYDPKVLAQAVIASL